MATGCRSPRPTGANRMIFPGKEWGRYQPEAVGLDAAMLKSAREWAIAQAGDAPQSAVIIRHGHLTAEWYKDTSPDQQHPMASVCKSVFCSMLGIAVAEGRIRSLDDRLVDYYPEMLECTADRGANAKQFVTEKDGAVTFRQIAAQISGYMEPNEATGRVFHYQTFGMATLMHAIAKQYGYYDPHDPTGSPGDGELIARKLRDPIGASWSWRYMNFKFSTTAKHEIFMNYPHLLMTTRDMARLGHLWLNWGQWNGRSIIPKTYHRAAVRVPQVTKDYIAPENWKYGYGLWVNESGRLWPNLPRDSYTAAGAGGRLIWVCPSLVLVVAQNPAVLEKNFDGLVLQSALLERITAACRS
jgi:CubicO group peptidase (beta-lactamase class C family)